VPFFITMNKTTQIFLLVGLILFSLTAVVFFVNPRIPVGASFLMLILFAVFVLAFFNTDCALVLLVFSMLLSPELKAGVLSSRTIIIRIEDILLIIVFFGWLAKVALNKELGLLRITPLNIPIYFYLFFCLVSSLWAVFNERLELKNSIFYLLKYLEYYLLFFMVSNNLTERRKIKLFVFFILIVGLVVGIYGWIQIPTGQRVSTPFEGEEGEPNTLAGYLILMLGLITGFFIHFARLRILLGIFWVILFVPFLYTLSRGGWVAFFPMVLAILFFTRRIKLPLFAFLLFATFIVFSAPSVLPTRVQSRIQETFSPGKKYQFFGREIILDESASERIETWKKGMDKFMQRPILGHGVPDAAVIDNQYIRVLRECGIFGFIAFLWLLVKLLALGYRNYRLNPDDDFVQALSLGFLAGFIGLLFHAFSAATFIIIRIMEPFWFLAALLVAAAEPNPEKNEDEDSSYQPLSA